MMSVCHAKMPAISNSNLGDIWRSKRQQPASQWYKQMVEREKSETQTKKRSLEILSRAPDMNPEVKPFRPRNKGLARSEGLWEMYCNQPEPVRFDRPAKIMRSSWPDVGLPTPDELPEQLESGEESSRLYEEKDFWGYFLPKSLFAKERDVSWGLSVPTDWKSPINLSFPITLLEDELVNLEYSQEISEDPDEVLSPKPKSKLLDLFKFVKTDLEDENTTPVPEDPLASLEKTDLESKAEELLEKEVSSEIEESEISSDVTISRSDEDKTNVSGNLNPSKDLLCTPSKSNSRKRRTLSGISGFLEVYEGCKFYRSNSSPVLTVI